MYTLRTRHIRHVFWCPSRARAPRYFTINFNCREATCVHILSRAINEVAHCTADETMEKKGSGTRRGTPQRRRTWLIIVGDFTFVAHSLSAFGEELAPRASYTCIHIMYAYRCNSAHSLWTWKYALVYAICFWRELGWISRGVTRIYRRNGFCVGCWECEIANYIGARVKWFLRIWKVAVFTIL